MKLVSRHFAGFLKKIVKPLLQSQLYNYLSKVNDFEAQTKMLQLIFPMSTSKLSVDKDKKYMIIYNQYYLWSRWVITLPCIKNIELSKQLGSVN